MVVGGISRVLRINLEKVILNFGGSFEFKVF